MNTEARLVTACSIAGLDDGARAECRRLLSSTPVRWELFLYYSVHHRVASIIYRNLETMDLLGLVELQVRNTLRTLYFANRRRNERMLAAILPVIEDLGRTAEMPVLIKGPAVELLAYGEIGLRTYEDIDLLIAREDAKRVDEALRRGGFVQGDYDPASGSIVPASREEIITLALHTHGTYGYVTLLDDEFMPAVPVDVNFEVFWRPASFSTQQHISTDLLLARTIVHPVSSTAVIRVLAPELQIIQLSAHAFSEALCFFVHKDWFRDKHDLQLIKFLDLYMVCAKFPVDWEAVHEIGEAHNALAGLAFTLHCVNELFPGAVPAPVVRRTAEHASRWLDAFVDREGNVHQWDAPFLDRMFDMDGKVGEIRRKFPTLTFG